MLSRIGISSTWSTRKRASHLLRKGDKFQLLSYDGWTGETYRHVLVVESGMLGGTLAARERDCAG
jgi:hypothetical protein